MLLLQLSLPMTRIRIFLAKILSQCITKFFPSRVRVCRQNVNYELDLAEGIDFSIFLFGSYQKHLFGAVANLPANAVAVDVGANIGAFCLSMAARYPHSQVYAIEPSDFAHAKLQANLKLNPDLMGRVHILKAFLGAQSSPPATSEVYARWPLCTEVGQLHRVHGGQAMQATNTPRWTLDEWAESCNLQRLDLIKIDTDGFEWDVLRGARQTLLAMRPTVVFEVGQYLLAEHNVRFADIYQFFLEMNYQLTDTRTHKVLSLQNYRHIIPANSTTDLCASVLKR